MKLKQHAGTAIASSMREISPSSSQAFRAAGQWRDRTFLDDFLDRVSESPHKAAVVSYVKGQAVPSTVTYSQLGAMVDAFAVVLLELGVAPGDVISIQAANGWEGPALSLATMRVGAVPHPIPIIYREREVRHMLEDARTKIYFAPQRFRGYDFEEMIKRLQPDAPGLEHAFYIGGDEHVGPGSSFESTFLAGRTAVPGDALKRLDELRPGADDIAMLVYTSGTTGTPKGALHTYNTAWSGYRNVIVDALTLTCDDVAFMASTLGHLTGFIHGMLVPLSMGQKVVYQDVWDVEGLLDLMPVEHVTWTLSSTTFAMDMVEGQRARGGNASSQTFRAFACGGAAIPPGVAVEMDRIFSTSLVPLWGCSETGIASIHRLGASVETLDSSDGYLVPWQETRIVDFAGDPTPDGQVGSLQVRGPGVFVGYLGRPDLLAEVFTEDGWYDTGDLGRATVDGGVRIEGRSKDVIIRGGQNISAVELENALYSHPKVLEVAVVAFPDDRLGERVCAVIVPRGEAPTLEEVVEHLEAAGMAKPFWPQRVKIVGSLPKTPSGKVQKFVLRNQLGHEVTA